MQAARPAKRHRGKFRMHIEFLVEEPSAEAALHNLVPMICGSDISFDIHAFRSKSDLLAKLPLRLKSYRKFLPPDWRIVVLIDEDRQDCIALKDVLEDAAIQAGLITRCRARGGSRFQVLNRIAVEELEAWGSLEMFRLFIKLMRRSPSPWAQNPPIKIRMQSKAEPGRQWSGNCKGRDISRVDWLKSKRLARFQQIWSRLETDPDLNSALFNNHIRLNRHANFHFFQNHPLFF